MSQELNQTQIVKEFLKEVKNKLPGWLKDNKKELKEVLSELESHIWEKAEEFAGGTAPQIHNVQQAIQEMGNPRAIAAEYKKRGTPKIWISRELFPAYLKTIGIVAGILVMFTTITFIVEAITAGFTWGLFSIFILEEIWASMIGGIIIVTIIFVALSMEGYLPEDFKKSRGKYQLKHLSTKSADKIDKVEQKRQQKRPKQVKPPLRRGELLAGGIIGILIGVAMIAEVWNYFPYVEQIGGELSTWIRIAGIFTLIGGSINLIQSMTDLTNYFAQRVLMSLNTITDLIFIYFIVQLLGMVTFITPTDDPILYQIFAQNPETYFGIVIGVKVLVGISIFGTVVGSISNIYKIITLRMKFEEYHRSLEI